MVALEKGQRQGDLAHAQPRAALHVTRFGDAGRAGGSRQYLYGTLAGPLGVAAKDGKLLWTFPRKFNVAVAPSPIAVNEELVFMTQLTTPAASWCGCGRGRHVQSGERVRHEEQRVELRGAHAIVYKGHMFAVGKKKRGLFTCLGFDGKEVWTSEGKASFGLASFLLADGMFFVLDGDTGKLRLIEAGTTAYNELASAQFLAGEESLGTNGTPRTASWCCEI